MGNGLTLLLHPPPQFQYPSRQCGAPSRPPLEVLPEVLDEIEVWGPCWTWYDLSVVVFEPVLGLFVGVLGVIVLLEDGVREGFCQDD